MPFSQLHFSPRHRRRFSVASCTHARVRSHRGAPRSIVSVAGDLSASCFSLVVEPIKPALSVSSGRKERRQTRNPTSMQITRQTDNRDFFSTRAHAFMQMRVRCSALTTRCFHVARCDPRVCEDSRGVNKTLTSLMFSPDLLFSSEIETCMCFKSFSP